MATHWPVARALARSGSSLMMPAPGHWQKNRVARTGAGPGWRGPRAANGPSHGQGPADQATLDTGGSAGAYGMASCQHALG